MSNILYLHKEKIKFCTKFKDRLIGMMFKRKQHKHIYCFPNCNSIHTFFMLKKIDIIMTDKDNNIIKYYKNFKPWKIILPKKNVYFIYEIDTTIINNIQSFTKINIK